MKKIIFTAVVLLVFIGISMTVWSVSAGSVNTIQNDLPYPPPMSTNQPGTPNEPQPQSLSTQAPYPAPVMLPTPNPLSNQVKNGLLLTDYTYKIFLPLILKSYDRVSAVAHADLFAHDRSEDFPNYGTGCGASCNDCTNYVSQSIFKGGLALKTGNWDENSPFEWWYKANYIGPIFIGYTNSKSWSSTDWFNTYLFQYPGKFEYKSWPTELEAGDFFLLDLHGATLNDPPDGIPDHARFVVGYGYSSTNQEDYDCQSNPIPPSTYDLLINQHCADRKHVLWYFNINGIPSWSFHVK